MVCLYIKPSDITLSKNILTSHAVDLPQGRRPPHALHQKLPADKTLHVAFDWAICSTYSVGTRNTRVLKAV